MRRIELPGGETIPVLGQGTWRMGEDSTRETAEIAALREGMDLGLSLIDTAEMYGDGGAEDLIGKAIAGRRDELFIVSKVYPHNASFEGTIDACERSLARLGTDRIDLYLLHWRGSARLEQTLRAFHKLVTDGKIRYFGVSNFDTDDMRDWHSLEGGGSVATNQILYNLDQRGPEWSLLPWCRKHRVPVMAYTPLEPATSTVHGALEAVAERHNATPAQIALAWVLEQPGVLTIPKASTSQHVRQNVAALDINLNDDDHADLNLSFPPPDGPSALEIR